MRRLVNSAFIFVIVLALWNASASANGLMGSTPLAVGVGDEAAALRQAYVYLEAGNHDYKGHRIKALRAVGRACQELGIKPKGDGHDRGLQKASDNELDSALALLTTVRETAVTEKQDKVISHVDQAIKEIGMALKMK